MSTSADITEQAVAEAIWSPSVHNTQPWLFTSDGHHIQVYADVSRLLTAADPYDRDGPADWVNAGQALQRILLTAAAYGAAVALHSQPLELPWLRETLRTRIGDGAYPQMALRLGVVSQVATSVRRDLSQVLFD
jgi:hypothetical protein